MIPITIVKLIGKLHPMTPTVTEITDDPHYSNTVLLGQMMA